VGILVCCPLIFLMVYSPFPWAWVACFAAEFCLFFNTGPSNTILANVTHPSVRATAFALNILLIHALGDAPSPPLLGHIADLFGWNAAFGLVVLTAGLGGVFWLLGARYLAADTAAASAPAT
jgi:MFS family permease